ncbi:hypothetical protein NDU88_004721 [Pleurodeles waltl]|uniref:Uncharacterized protein n=1 Tax=Pleurodeles waltl TaxID=8319 RepID=A0AAV7W5S3_PLEWA|nr:hypothetical protein NDU88_004721 [Pleurodeles waltl]
MMHQLWYVDSLIVPALLPGPAPHDAPAMGRLLMMHQLWYVDSLTVPALLPGPAPHDAPAMVCGFFDCARIAPGAGSS